MKRAFIFLNGELSQINKIEPKPGDQLIGVDGGTEHILRLGLRPDLVIGDLDSLKKVPANVPLIKYPKEKDFTDTELALQYCEKQKFEEVIIVGFLGRRLDHLLANILNLIKFKLQIKIIEGDQEIFLCRERLEINGKKGDLVSLIPLSGDCQGVTTKGLKWCLQVCSLKVGESRGVSNVMTGEKAVVRVKSGCLLVVKTAGRAGRRRLGYLPQKTCGR